MPASILIIDDEVDFAESIGDALEMESYQVSLAFNGTQGIAALRAQPYDLVLLDMKMPDMDGIRCLKELRGVRPQVKVVMISAFSKNELMQQALERGAAGVFHKPVEPFLLMDVLAFLKTGAKILLVDDNGDFMDSMDQLLCEEGYDVRKSQNLDQARKALEESTADLILLDYQLVGESGLELLGWLRERQRSEPVVLVTGHGGQLALENAPEVLFVEAQNLLMKPIPIEKLLDEVSARVGGAI